MLVSYSTNEVEGAVVVDVLMNNIYCTSHGGKTTVRAAEWRDTEGVGGFQITMIYTHTHTLPQSHSVSSLPSLYALTERATGCTHRDTASFS